MNIPRPTLTEPNIHSNPFLARLFDLISAGHRFRPKAAPFAGRVAIGDYSSLRKRMRAAARGRLDPMVPDERAKLRHAWYRKELQTKYLRELVADALASQAAE